VEHYPAGGAVVVVATGDPVLRDAVLSLAAAAGLEPEVVADAGLLRPSWTRAPLLVVGADVAEDVVAMALPRRGGVYVAGLEAPPAELCGWSTQLGAAVAVLPEAAGWLSTAMAEAAGVPVGSGVLVAVRGAAGGVGASTVAAGLAVVGARLGRRVLLVDGDAEAGGIDLVLGAERVDGWRWSRLARARGRLGDLSGCLPRVDGVDVLAIDREDTRPLQAEQLVAVVRSATRSHDLVVVDVPRSDTAAGAEALRLAHLPLLLVPADVRGVAAARGMLRRIEADVAVRLLVRRLRGPGLSPDTVADSLRLPLAGVVLDDAALVAATVRGEPPARAARSPLARLCRDLLEESAGGRAVA